MALAAALAVPAEARPPAPNFLVIVADDLGFSDLGAFGGEIATPNLDRLALSGVRLTGFHTAPICSPTRAMLLSGMDGHRAGVGSIKALLAPNQKQSPAYQGHLLPNVASLAEIFSAGGYRTLFAGKWDLGQAPEHGPDRRGFERSFALLPGGGNHFGTDLSPDPAKGVAYREDGRIVTSLPKDFYSSDYFASKLIGQLRATADGRPLFAYLAFTAPHWPLQAPADVIARYHGRYDAGYDALRAERLRRQIDLGLVPAAAAQHPLLRAQSWKHLSANEKRASARKMEVYAAMVDRLDQNVGRVVAELKARGVFENTVILFLSDNGAEGLDLATSANPRYRRLAEQADNDDANLGSATSFFSYGPAWAQAATPSWLYKGYPTEGGTRTVAFLTGPAVRKAGAIEGAYLSVADVAPTLLDLAKIARPGSRFNGREVRPMTGKSWRRWLAGKVSRVYREAQAIGTELFGARSIRRGDWKITDPGDGSWRLFNIARDPAETTDLSSAHPAVKHELEKAWKVYSDHVGVVTPAPAFSFE